MCICLFWLIIQYHHHLQPNERGRGASCWMEEMLPGTFTPNKDGRETPHSFPVVISSLTSQLMKNDLTLVFIVQVNINAYYVLADLLTICICILTAFLGEEESAIRIYFGGGLQPHLLVKRNYSSAKKNSMLEFCV